MGQIPVRLAATVSGKKLDSEISQLLHPMGKKTKVSDIHIWTIVNPSSANPTKWPSTLKQLVGILPKNYLSVFDHFVGLALKGLR